MPYRYTDNRFVSFLDSWNKVCTYIIDNEGIENIRNVLDDD